MNHKKRTILLSISLLMAILFCFTACALPEPRTGKKDDDESSSSADANADDKKNDDEGDSSKDDDDDTIVAGSVDTSSKFSFEVETAVIGIDYAEQPIVVVVGTFTNDSEEKISLNWAVDATAMQGGYTLSSTYISGSNEYNYNDIDPGTKIPVFIGWKISDAEKDITLTVVDRQHYAKEEIFSQKFTIDELVQNTLDFYDADEIFEEGIA